jgi:thiopurine S-methyltransferase
MDAEFWLERWRRGETGWHRDEVNPWLVRHADRLPTTGRVFVPLCGKTLDVAWLRARGLAVRGVDLSPIAAEAMFAEAGWPVALDDGNGLVIHRTADDGPPVEFWVGDLFSLPAEAWSDVDAVWDRAAYHALPPAMRAEYAHHMQSVLPAAAGILLVTIDYPEGSREGPPFRIEPGEIEALWGRAGRRVERLAAADSEGRYNFDAPVREDVWWIGPVAH